LWKILSLECNKGKEINFTKVEFLVEYGSYLNEKGNLGETPLFNACRSGNEGIVKYLVEHGAYVNKENYEGKNPLFISFDN